ncbi:HTH domain-containing protein [Lactiplantibacillus plantarum]|uniref:HTH domain-containing protein n=1 Tax=Lactiplantibacillus plantarum TaxID=1590 RepID=UPI00307A4BE7
MLKTIRELADELGVSKQKVRRVIAKLSASKAPSGKGNRYVLNALNVKNAEDLMGFDNDKSSTSESTNELNKFMIFAEM